MLDPKSGDFGYKSTEVPDRRAFRQSLLHALKLVEVALPMIDAEMMQQAKEDFRTQQYVVCLVRCDTIRSRFGDLPEGVEATELVEKITSNPEWMQQVCDTLLGSKSARGVDATVIVLQIPPRRRRTRGPITPAR